MKIEKETNPAHCYNCGAKVSKSHKYCSSCGIELNWSFIDNDEIIEPQEQLHHNQPKKIDIPDLFYKMESTLKKESGLTDEEFEIHWGKFKNYHYKNYNDNDIFWIIVSVVFYSGFKAGIASSKLPMIKKYLGDYKATKEYTKSDVNRILEDPGIIHNQKKIQACISNAKRFSRLVEKFGSFIPFLESSGNLSDDAVLEIVRDKLMQFDFIGPITAYHVMLDLGLNVWKPDRVICRILERLGLISDRNNTEEAIKVGKLFTIEIGLPIRYIDIIMVKYGQQGPEEPFGLKDGICLEKNPQCQVCGIVEYCGYGFKKPLNYSITFNPEMQNYLKKRFNSAMWDLYHRAKREANYIATRYLQMLNKNGGLETAYILINSPKVSDGYTALWERGRLDLTVEAFIWDNPEYQELFTEDQLRIAKKRLVDYHYTPALKK